MWPGSRATTEGRQITAKGRPGALSKTLFLGLWVISRFATTIFLDAAKPLLQLTLDGTPYGNEIVADRRAFQGWWMSNLRILFTAISAIVLFLYGLEAFSREIQAVGGETLRQWLGRLTESRWRALVLGIVATAIIQSGSAVTSLTVALVMPELWLSAPAWAYC
jgi:hypothetical protein